MGFMQGPKRKSHVRFRSHGGSDSKGGGGSRASLAFNLRAPTRYGGPKIQTPRGTITIMENGKAQLVWNKGFGPKWREQYTSAQKFVDSEVVRLCEPYTPLLTGMLKMSGTLGTYIGSGTVSWIAPYARRQYYMKREIGTQTGPLRGPFWFERMKQVYKPSIVAGARKLAGGK